MNPDELTNERLPDPPPERGSAALLEYYWASQCDFRLFSFLIDTVLVGDYVAHLAQKALKGAAETEEKLTPADLAQHDPGSRTVALRQSRQELIEMLLSRAVDNFQVYLVQVIRDVLQKKPVILSSRTQELTLGYILQFDSIGSLTLDIIEAKMSSLSYQGFGEVETWCQERGIPLVIPDGFREAIVELIATRNLIIHNRGLVDARYLASNPNSSYKGGAKRQIEIDDLLDAHRLLNRVVSLSDSAIAGKFHLPIVGVRGELIKRGRDRWPSPKAKSDGEDPIGKAAV
jgi:hypothetical protein